MDPIKTCCRLLIFLSLSKQIKLVQFYEEAVSIGEVEVKVEAEVEQVYLERQFLLFCVVEVWVWFYSGITERALGG